MKALVFGDIHSQTAKVRELALKLQGQAIEIILVTGDFTNEGMPRFAEETVAILEESFPKARIFAVPGNQDGPEIISFLEKKGMSLHKLSSCFRLSIHCCCRSHRCYNRSRFQTWRRLTIAPAAHHNYSSKQHAAGSALCKLGHDKVNDRQDKRAWYPY